MSIAEIAVTARTLLRDFPHFFETELGPLNTLSIRLPHPLVSSASLQVYVWNDPTSTLTTSWALDERNGILKITDEDLLSGRVLISGYHYTWFTDTDLGIAAKMAADEALYNTSGSYDTLDGVVGEVVAMGAVVRALWSLSTELSLDIDVSTPEGMFIPARQRFQQVLQMMQYWEGQYTTRAAELNIGLGQLEVFRLRRVAKLTNRYVPVYLEREFDDRRYPQRIYPTIPDGTMQSIEASEDIIDVVESMDPMKPRRPSVGASELGWPLTSGAP